MSGKWKSPLLAAAIILLLGSRTPLLAGFPLDNLFSLHRVEADPNRSYDLTEECGPWMIMACSFGGPQAEKQAHELVLELRERYKLPSYQYKKEFEFGPPQARGVDRYGNPVRMKYQHGAELQEVAVLVGNYHTVDEKEAKETLEKIKYQVNPKCFSKADPNSDSRMLAGLREWYESWTVPGKETKSAGPWAMPSWPPTRCCPTTTSCPKGSTNSC